MKPRLCARDGCGQPIPAKRLTFQATYCSPRCGELAKRDRRGPMAGARIMAALEQAAKSGLQHLAVEAIAKHSETSPRSFWEHANKLSDAGRIYLSGNRGHRVITLASGHMIGLSEAVAKAKPIQQVAVPPCRWCGKPVKLHKDIPSALTCSVGCHREFMAHGASASKAQIQTRLDHISRQPKGCVTVEDFIRAGGIIYSEPARGIPA